MKLRTDVDSMLTQAATKIRSPLQQNLEITKDELAPIREAVEGKVFDWYPKGKENE